MENHQRVFEGNGFTVKLKLGDSFIPHGIRERITKRDWSIIRAFTVVTCHASSNNYINELWVNLYLEKWIEKPEAFFTYLFGFPSMKVLCLIALLQQSGFHSQEFDKPLHMETYWLNIFSYFLKNRSTPSDTE